MRRCILSAACIAMFATFAATSFADLFKWRDRVRPPVSLKQALTIAESLLGEDAKNRFCIEVSIYGNPTGAPKPGAWNLFFAADDGSKKHVYVDMDGNGKISTWNEAIDWTKDAGRRKDIQDVQERLKALFDKETLDATLERDGERLIARYRARMYEIYRAEKDGSFAEDLTKEVGPKHDGFIIEAQIVEEGTDYFHFEHGPYWIEHTQLFPTTEKGKLMLVRKRYGRNFKQELLAQIDQAFGVDFVTP